jgi:hypothetical protein|tara:strand:- start:196 stop:801 length:606 start_codon:yes stop_codon:yes gene_type:complete
MQHFNVINYFKINSQFYDIKSLHIYNLRKFMKKNIFCLFIAYFVIFQMLVSCGIYRPVDAKKYPPQPELRVKNNLKEGKGIQFFKSDEKGGKFEFANANPLWRASLDTIDFMPLLSVDYGGGIIITDWYGEENENNAIKISIQFLSNEVRSDSLNIKVFKKNCTDLSNCKVTQSQSDINQELRVAILKKAAQYKLENAKKN